MAAAADDGRVHAALGKCSQGIREDVVSGCDDHLGEALCEVFVEHAQQGLVCAVDAGLRDVADPWPGATYVQQADVAGADDNLITWPPSDFALKHVLDPRDSGEVGDGSAREILYVDDEETAALLFHCGEH